MTHIHTSLLHSADDAAVAAFIDRLAAKRPRSISTTESTGFRAELLAAGYVTVHDRGTDGQGESAILLRNDAFRRALPALRLSDMPIPRRGGDKVYAARVDTVHDGQILAVHMPSGVEGATGFRSTEQARVYRDAIGGLRRYVASHPEVNEIHGDWNLRADLRWVRAYFRLHFPDFDIVAPSTGTHGSRAIDWALIRRGHRRYTAAAHPNPVSDHETVVFTPLEIPMAHPKTDALVAALRRRGVEVLTHEQWGSQHASLYVQRLRTHPHGLLPGRPVDTLWNHITVTNDDGPLLGDFKADMREVERIGFQRFGSGFSYNIGVDRNADRPRVAIGQFLEAKGTHTVNDKGAAGFSFNQNKVALAVAWVGVPGDKLNPHAITALVQLRAALIEVGAMTSSYDDVPHSLVAAKDCPTDELRNRLPELKRLGLAAVKPRTAAPAPSRVTRVKAALLAVLNGPDARGISADRRFVRGLLATIRATVNRLPER